MDELKVKLIAVLETEKQRLDNIGVDTHAHYLTIDYLKTGTYGCDPKEVGQYPLLDIAIDNYNYLLLDYGVITKEQHQHKEKFGTYDFPLIGYPHKYFTIELSGYLLNLEIESIDFKPTVSDEVIIKCKIFKK